MEMAIVRSTRPGPDTRVYELTDVRDRRTWLRFRRLAPGEPDVEGPIRVSASVGRFGDPKKERRLLNVLDRRLDRLIRID